MQVISAEQIKKNYDKFLKLSKNIGDGRGDKLEVMIEHFGDRLALCPASARKEHHSAFHGGLVDHSLRVLKYAINLNETLGFSHSKDSIVLTSLCHDLGKIGDIDNPYYVPQLSDWHREKGMFYAYNEKLQFMCVQHRSLYILQHFGVNLTQDEYLAILLHDGQYTKSNDGYGMKEPNLALMIHHADLYASLWEKENISYEGV